MLLRVWKWVTRVCSCFVTLFTKFESASSSGDIPIQSQWFSCYVCTKKWENWVKFGISPEEDANSNFVKRVPKRESTLVSGHSSLTSLSCGALRYWEPLSTSQSPHESDVSAILADLYIWFWHYKFCIYQVVLVIKYFKMPISYSPFMKVPWKNRYLCRNSITKSFLIRNLI